MAEKSSAAFGIFSDRLSTEMAIETLRATGFRATDISSLFPDDVCTRKTPHQNTRMLQGAAAGAGAGAVIGYALGWLTGIAMSSDPVHQTLLAGTPLVTSLASLGTGGALGSLIGALIGGRIPNTENTTRDACRPINPPIRLPRAPPVPRLASEVSRGVPASRV